MKKLCAQFSFKWHNSSVYNAPTNGLVKTFNKILYYIPKKVVNRSKKNYHDKIKKKNTIGLSYYIQNAN
jgi:hypothetical protein